MEDSSDDPSCCQCDATPGNERNCHESTIAQRERHRGQIDSFSLSVDWVSSADRPPAYNDAEDTIDREKAREGKNKSKHHWIEFSPEVRSTPTEDRDRETAGVVLGSCRYFLPLRESQQSGELSSGFVDGGLRDNITVLPAWEEKRCAWLDDRTPSDCCFISSGTGHDRGKADIGICLSGAAAAVRHQEVARKLYRGSEHVCKHASTSRTLKTIDWCTILVGGIATLAIINFDPSPDHQRLKDLPLRSNLSQGLIWPSFPSYLAAICAYSAVGIYHLGRRPRHWADCGLLAVIGSVSTGAWLGRRAMVDALIIGAFSSLVCSKAIESMLDRWFMGTTADAYELRCPYCPSRARQPSISATKWSTALWKLAD